uniref:Uncharacterized protein n=1 Tax=Timema shepardi TaxID=629360 RepID=A0A7R9AKL3_TIMSH|nr:unnamed protein product [Timema shepardi]
MERVHQHLCGRIVVNHLGNTTISTPDRPTKAVHPSEIRTSISPSSAVELNTTSALANYATEAGATKRTHRQTVTNGRDSTQNNQADCMFFSTCTYWSNQSCPLSLPPSHFSHSPNPQQAPSIPGTLPFDHIRVWQRDRPVLVVVPCICAPCYLCLPPCLAGGRRPSRLTGGSEGPKGSGGFQTLSSHHPYKYKLSGSLKAVLGSRLKSPGVRVARAAVVCTAWEWTGVSSERTCVSIHPAEIRTSISPSSAVELNTKSALVNYATEAGHSSPDRDSNLDILVLGSRAQRETSTLAIYATELPNGLRGDTIIFDWPADYGEIRVEISVGSTRANFLNCFPLSFQDNAVVVNFSSLLSAARIEGLISCCLSINCPNSSMWSMGCVYVEIGFPGSYQILVPPQTENLLSTQQQPRKAEGFVVMYKQHHLFAEFAKDFKYSSPIASLVLTDSSQLTSDSQHLVYLNTKPVRHRGKLLFALLETERSEYIFYFPLLVTERSEYLYYFPLLVTERSEYIFYFPLLVTERSEYIFYFPLLVTERSEYIFYFPLLRSEYLFYFPLLVTKRSEYLFYFPLLVTERSEYLFYFPLLITERLEYLFYFPLLVTKRSEFLFYFPLLITESTDATNH